MSLSSPTKTRWFSDSDRKPAPVPFEPDVLIGLRDVSLRFLSYHDKQYSLKQAAVDMVLRRQAPPVASDFWALKNITMRIRKGDRFGIVGANGAGKSTLLRVLAKIYPPSSGFIQFRGNVAPLIEMGAGFNPELSGKENIRLNGAMLGFTRKEMDEKTDGIFEFTGLREFADLPLKYYSSGMYTRLAFAIASEVEPEILLIDESLGTGDAAFITKAKQRIKGLLDRSNAVVIVSHDMKALKEMCNRGIRLERGVITDGGPIDDVVNNYLDSIKAPRV